MVTWHFCFSCTSGCNKNRWISDSCSHDQNKQTRSQSGGMSRNFDL